MQLLHEQVEDLENKLEAQADNMPAMVRRMPGVSEGVELQREILSVMYAMAEVIDEMRLAQ